MGHIALYRKWRPQSFEDVVGQQHITKTLTNALREGRYSHAYLFSGPRGTGKTSAAKILAKAVNCEQGPEAGPCNECEVCRRITDGSVMDVLEIDAASNRGVEEMRDIRDHVKFAPTEVRRKVYIIDEVHMLTTEAFNALLKTLEEPPEHVMFILATTEPHKLPTTIISRCQRFDFKRVAVSDQLSRLRWICEQEGIEAESEALMHVARQSDGGMRDALSLLDQIVAFSGGAVTVEDVLAVTGNIAADTFGQLAEIIGQRQAGEALEWIDLRMQEGKSADRCMESLIHYFRDLLMLKTIDASDTLVSDNDSKMKEAASQFESNLLFDMIEVLNHFQGEMKYSSQPRTLLEVAILKLCHPRDASSAEAASSPPSQSSVSDTAVKQLLQRVEQLENQVEQLRKTRPAETVEAEQGKPERAARSKARSSASGSNRRHVNVEPFLKGNDPAALRRITQEWSQVLNQVKQTKITVHAWLVDGEPVACTEDSILLAFKSEMHRDTTEREANRELIERELNTIFAQPYTLVTVMQDDWQAAQEKQPAMDSATTADTDSAAEEREDQAAQPEWIDKAVSLFGEELVTIINDNK